MTYLEEVEETIGIPLEVEPLDHMKLEDLGLNTCSNDLFLSSREVPSVDEPEPQLLPNFPSLDLNLGDKIGTDPPINPYSLGNFRIKDETSSILRNFITEIENLKDLKVKIIKCDNGGEFRNREMDEFCSKKCIKIEFSNARTPQQNGVVERRNRTLIEAARTISPAIGFLRPFGCHVMIFNTLDQLGKFDAKGDEGYFVGYSLSSKAFKVFNKRTKKVEENLHVDFLENKPIEKGDGPNWLFDIDTLTNLMNYVPVVVAGTSSTNISGTKEDANQAIKESVSSLRFIALPNWFDKAHMAPSHDSTRKSDAFLEKDAFHYEQDSNAGVSKSSGNTNPTATSKDPTANQVEPVLSLTVETEVPTVSSHVPTDCLSIPHVSSSGLRIISRG
ncbi:putative ribonuclease H-like domain-containing protein, partial [Tanacetum coccineum]